jgi:ribose transport system permease protein
MRARGRSVWLDRNPWVWSFAGAAIVWLLTLATVEGRGALATLSVALQFATFYVIVGLGQMLVISASPGNIDLSIPAVMTLAGYISMRLMGGSDAGLWAGIGAAIAVALAAGVVNIVLIQGLLIPPMIGTIAAGFVIQSVAIAYSSGSTAKPAPALVQFTAERVFGLPVIALVFIALAIVVAAGLRRSVFGRSVLAVGQNPRAASLAGLHINRTLAGVYLISALLASVAGLSLAAYSGGASLSSTWARIIY